MIIQTRVVRGQIVYCTSQFTNAYVYIYIYLYIRFLRALQTDSFNTWTCIYGCLGLMSYIKLLILYVEALRIIVLIISKNFFFNPKLGAFFLLLRDSFVHYYISHSAMWRRAYDSYIELYNNIIKSIIVCSEHLT